MTYYIISTRQRPSALNYSRELPSKATKPSNMAEPLGSSCSRRRRRRRGIGTRTRPHTRTRADSRAARRAPRPPRPARVPAAEGFGRGAGLRAAWVRAAAGGRAGSRAGPCVRRRAHTRHSRGEALSAGRLAGYGGRTVWIKLISGSLLPQGGAL